MFYQSPPQPFKKKKNQPPFQRIIFTNSYLFLSFINIIFFFSIFLLSIMRCYKMKYIYIYIYIYIYMKSKLMNWVSEREKDDTLMYCRNM